jgi:L-alanine-DL-glutamate epimerase-like enolase superfamily enzyme
MIFVRLVTRQGKSAWGCCVASSDPADAVLRACQDCAAMVPDLNPTNIEFSLAELSDLTRSAPSALCAFDLAFHDLLGITTGMPLTGCWAVTEPHPDIRHDLDRLGTGERGSRG